MYDKKEHYEKPYYQSSVILLFTLQVQAGITLAHGAHCSQVDYLFLSIFIILDIEIFGKTVYPLKTRKSETQLEQTP